jgi:hypothetical protein
MTVRVDPRPCVSHEASEEAKTTAIKTKRIPSSPRNPGSQMPFLQCFHNERVRRDNASCSATLSFKRSPPAPDEPDWSGPLTIVMMAGSHWKQAHPSCQFEDLVLRPDVTWWRET